MAELNVPAAKKTPWVIAGVAGAVAVLAVVNALWGTPSVPPLEEHPPAVCVSKCGAQLVAPIPTGSLWTCAYWREMEDHWLGDGGHGPLCEAFGRWEVGVGGAVRVDCAHRVATVTEKNGIFAMGRVLNAVATDCRDGGP